MISPSCLAEDLWKLSHHITFKVVSCWLQVPVLVGYVYARCRRYDNMVMKVSTSFIEVTTTSLYLLGLASTPSERIEHATWIDHVFAANVCNFPTPHQRHQPRRHPTRSVLRRARIRGSAILDKGHGISKVILPVSCHQRHPLFSTGTIREVSETLRSCQKPRRRDADGASSVLHSSTRGAERDAFCNSVLQQYTFALPLDRLSRY